MQGIAIWQKRSVRVALINQNDGLLYIVRNISYKWTEAVYCILFLQEILSEQLIVVTGMTEIGMGSEVDFNG